MMMMIHLFDAECVIDEERKMKMANWATFELLVEKDTENDIQSVEMQVAKTEHWDRYSFVRMA